jgi:tripartite-type tricarboxylate transporter receptor subunit TctC
MCCKNINGDTAMNSRWIKTFLKIFFCLLTGCVGAVYAQSNYPIKPIRFIVPFPPGGGAESSARLVAQKLSESMGQPVIVETKSGAGGNIGTEFVARAQPDGYTILLATNGMAIQPNLQKLSWDPIKDFVPVSLIASYALVLAVHPSLPVSTLQELITYARANPGKLTYGSSGSGGPLHMGAELFRSQAKVNLLHVPYKGNAPMTLAILSGEINMVFDSPVGPLPNIRAGKLRALATTGNRRTASLPETPTAMEAGLPNFEYESWNGIVVPAGTPKEIVARLNAEVVKAMSSNEVRDRFKGLGYEPRSTTSEEFGSIIASDLLRFAKAVKEVGMKLD